MKSFLLACAALIATIASGQAGAKQVSCPGFAEGKGSSPTEVDRFYAERATAIVRAALISDTATVSTLVSPRAQFSTWRGDNATGSRKNGTAGAIEWARDLDPSGFESLINRPGPISIVTLKCEQTTTVLFRTRVAGTGVNVTFKFVGGRLVQATGHEVLLLEGDVS